MHRSFTTQKHRRHASASLGETSHRVPDSLSMSYVYADSNAQIHIAWQTQAAFCNKFLTPKEKKIQSRSPLKMSLISFCTVPQRKHCEDNLLLSRSSLIVSLCV